MLRNTSMTLFHARFQSMRGGFNALSALSKRELASKLLDRIVQNIEQETNPCIIKHILNITALDQFKTSDTNFNNFLVQLQLKPLNAAQLINKTKKSILDIRRIRHLLALIQQKGLISDLEIQRSASALQFQLNLMYLFEGLTISTINSCVLGEEIFAHLLAKRKSPKSGETLSNFMFGFSKETTIFERLKIISIDPGMARFARYKSTADREETTHDTNKFERKYHLTQLNANSKPATFSKAKDNVLKSCLAINILEAAWQDARQSTQQGNIDNAISSFGLIGILEHQRFHMEFKIKSKVAPTDCNIDEAGNYNLLPSLKVNLDPLKFGEIEMNSMWRDLYSTWNIFFTLANIDTLFLPIKLLVPSVLSAQPEQYIESRVALLFVMANMFLSEEIRTNPTLPNQSKLEHADDIFQLWGMLNKQYAEQVLSASCPNTDKSVTKLFQESLGDNINWNFTRHMIRFIAHQDTFELTNLKHSALSTQSFFKYPIKIPNESLNEEIFFHPW